MSYISTLLPFEATILSNCEAAIERCLHTIEGGYGKRSCVVIKAKHEKYRLDKIVAELKLRALRRSGENNEALKSKLEATVARKERIMQKLENNHPEMF